MRRMLVIACCGFGVGLVAPPSAAAAGGPVPPLQGGAGVSLPGRDVNYVALAAGRKTVVARVRRAGGIVERSRLLPGSFGIPGAAYDGSGTGLSADGRMLVLAGAISRYPVARTRLLVLDARRLRARARIVLPGAFAVDAISPTGRWLYLIHYTSSGDTSRYDVRAYDVPGHHLVAAPVVDPRERDEAMRGLPSQVLDVSFDDLSRIARRDLAGGGFGFGQALARVLFAEQKLTLKITSFDIVPIDDAQTADAGSGQ